MGDESRFADAVIVAAGSSRRMGGLDKLDQDLGGRSVLGRSVDAMLAATTVRGVVLVVAPPRVEEFRGRHWAAEGHVRVVAGGDRRQDSVAAGVRAAVGEVVLVHDGARPLVSPQLADAVADAARRDGAAIPVVPVPDSLKRVDGTAVVAAVSRDGVFAAQTPQGARRHLLLAALEAAPADATYTDEAAVLAAHGVSVTTVPGEAWNLKLTVPADLELARRLVTDGKPPTGTTVRVGTGIDSHPFGPAAGLRLGGIEVPAAPRLFGHSDGDVVLHALCDALLGAAGLPDIGRAFPAGDAATRGIDSSRLVAAVVQQVADSGWRARSADITVVGARPRLGGRRLDEMGAVIAELLAIEPASVGVKAATGNLSGDEGAGRVIRAVVTVTLTPSAQ